MGPADSRYRRLRLFIPASRWVPPATPGLPGSSTCLSARAPPKPPRAARRVLTPVASPPVTGFTFFGRMSTAIKRNEAESGSLHWGSRLRLLSWLHRLMPVREVPGRTDPLLPGGYPRGRGRGYMLNGQFARPIPFNRIDTPVLPWRTKGAKGRDLAIVRVSSPSLRGLFRLSRLLLPR